MKRVLLIAFGLVLAVGVQAQEEKEPSGNRMWIGGSGGFGTQGFNSGESDTKDYKTTSFNVGPTFGFMLTDKMAVGINVLFDGSTQKKENNTHDINKTTGYNFEPFFRFYFAGAGNFKFYGDATVNFGGGKTSWENQNSTEPNITKYSRFGIGIHPGVQYWFTDNWSMASTIGIIGYQSRNQEKWVNDDQGKAYTVEDKTSNIYFLGNFSTLSFSFFYHF